ncbi:MAG: glycoside hydrolase family 2 [Prevotellaceae bacterium]|jgi:hypothetical protein|nr:glycoside hydrolase family 2 [Prevotellaceae bacterium]
MKIKKLSLLLIFFFAISFVNAQFPVQKGKREKESLSLAGIWQFKLDPMNVSIPVKGSDFIQKLPETIILPGSTDQAGKGYKTQDMTSIRLSRVFEYSGAAWYEKNNIFIPDEWKGKDIFIFLERAHWETKTWVNGQAAGRRESLSTPHIYDITPYVIFGKKNTIRFRVDNGQIYNLAYTHALSAETQTNWNGIVGEIKVQALDKVRISNVQIYPNRKDKKMKIVVEIVNNTKKPARGNLNLKCKTFDEKNLIELSDKNVNFEVSDSLSQMYVEYKLGDSILLWDEFDPNLYELHVSLSSDDKLYKDETKIKFGIRDFATKGTQFTINDRITFIRGAVNSCEFPLTGYPPTEKEEWYRIMKTYKDYGINCIRFHSWCPPDAAFCVADELGLYLQIENSDWRFTVGDDEATNEFYFDEARKIFDTYGNHPSFVFFCEGNELVGKGCVPFLKKMLEQWKTDTRKLYVAASGYPTVEGSDFYEFYGARPQRWKEGLGGRFNSKPLNTRYDYAEYVKKFDIPMITHEIGQWCAYPDFKQVLKYTGVLKPYNYELFREGLREKNMLSQAEDFHLASGKFQVIQKKEEFESYFRTPGFGGYHLLQLNDFPGQGTSPVGVVDVFYNPKNYVDAEEFRRIQNPQMLLLRTDKLTWTSKENFVADAQFVNFGKNEIKNARICWTVKNKEGTIAEGLFAPIDCPIGIIVKVGELSVPLNKVKKADSYDVIFSIEETDIFNKWKIWIYPAELPELRSENILITDKWDTKAKQYLEKGGKVFLIADTALINSDIPPGFSGISWNAVWSGTPPNTLGILCNPAHKALENFPTEFHSNWQWFDLVRNSKPFLIDHTPYEFKPVVQIIPDWNNNQKIALVIEARIGKGKLLMTSINLRGIMKTSPVARQLYYSLLNYISNDFFNPEIVLSAEMINRIIKIHKK